MLLEILLALIFLGIFAGISELLICYYIRNYYAHKYLKIFWHFRFRTYEFDLPSPYQSLYSTKYPKPGEERSVLISVCTTDDPALCQIAEEFDSLFCFKSDRWRLACLQAMIQQNVYYDYNPHSPRYPYNTLCFKQGDCKDSSQVFVTLAVILGYTAQYCILEDGHVVPSVLLDDGWTSFELTSSISAPIYPNEKDMIYRVSV